MALRKAFLISICSGLWLYGDFASHTLKLCRSQSIRGRNGRKNKDMRQFNNILPKAERAGGNPHPRPEALQRWGWEATFFNRTYARRKLASQKPQVKPSSSSASSALDSFFRFFLLAPRTRVSLAFYSFAVRVSPDTGSMMAKEHFSVELEMKWKYPKGIPARWL